ncbi:MAG: mechanosensitive ion channel protein MscS [Enterovirga sp.]|nr:mechanosensitive ion channel protein MscS [Enterovirga sp.]
MLKTILAAVLAAFVVVGAPVGAWAQAPAPAPAAAAVPRPPSPLKPRLEATRAQLEQVAAALQRPSLSNADLQTLRAQVDPLAETVRGIIEELTPQLDAAKARLDQLGPKPKDGAAPEGADVARDRTEREAALAEFDDTSRLARALLLEAEQLASQISDRRRTAFTTALFERSYSFLSPDLWMLAGQSLPRDLRALTIMAQDSAGRFGARASPLSLTLLALALGLTIAFHIARKHVAPRFANRSAELAEVDRRRRLRVAVGRLVLGTLPWALGGIVIHYVVTTADLLPPRLNPVLGAVLTGISFVVFVHAALDAVLAPDRPAWRLLPTTDLTASRMMSFTVTFAVVVATGGVLDAGNRAIAAGLPVTVLVRALVALTAAGILAELLRRFAVTEESQEDCLGPYIPTEPAIAGPVRLMGWVIVAAIVGTVLSGHIAFASFLTEQVAWIGSLAILFYLAVALVDEFVGETLRKQTPLATTLQANLGLRRRALEQLGVLFTGAARVVLAIVAAMLALAPWGLESADIASNLRAAFFGFKVGDVTISLSTTIFALVLFGGAIFATRIVQRWLAATFLPTTELDAGLRNSIQTAAGYVGFFAAAALALSYLGLGLEKIAIVAGALSVGIGFGLQSIVNNFVSGLILLWERPIRVGDLVVIGDGEGYVRRISVRATEIETFDRSSVIIPNSNLISGVVKNRVRGDRSGRVIISITIGRDKDPARTAELLVAEASRHADVLKEPPPRVVFKKIGDASLELDLVCFVDDVTKQVRVQSDLNYAIFGALVAQGIVPMPGPGAMNIGGMEQVQAALQHIADAIAQERARTGPGAGGDGASRPGAAPGA